MRGASLLLVFVAAKLAVVWSYSVPLSSAAIVAYIWQDAAVALAFAVLDRGLTTLRAPAQIAGWIYWAVAIYAAINIPVGRVVFTPLTPAMLRATRGPLADSILQYVTASNILLVAAVLATAAVLPRLLRQAPRLLAIGFYVCLVILVLVGPMAARLVDTGGMDRNVLTALMGGGLPPVVAQAAAVDWRESPFPKERSTDNLSQFAAAARGLNVIMISLESTAVQYLPLYDVSNKDRQDPMPNLTVLAQRALVFENAYAVYPESIKGLFSVLCSEYPAFDSRPEEYESAECSSVATVLSNAGYRTAMFHSGRFDYLGMQSIIRHRGYQILEDAGDIGGNHHSSFGVDEPATVARMLAWIDGLPRGQRFFLTYLPIAGHHPYATPERGPFQGTDEIDQYRNALHYGDVSLGILMEGLRARGLDQSTIWVIYGDHGEAFQQHEGNYGHTFFVYEENVHVPMLIAAPGLIGRQERVRKVVSLVDIAPTILHLMGIPPPASYQGRTMLADTSQMALFFADYSLGLLGLRDGSWKFIYEIGSGRAKLFDLATDPREKSDLSAHEVLRVSRYGQLVRAWCSAQKSNMSKKVLR